MFGYSGRNPLLAALALMIAVLITPFAFARIVHNTIDPFANIKAKGRQIVVTGPVECTAGEIFDVRVTVTQRETGAFAEGQARLTCTGVTEHWLIDASTRGREPFQAGPATASAVGITSNRGATTDAHQWLVNITD